MRHDRYAFPYIFEYVGKDSLRKKRLRLNPATAGEADGARVGKDSLRKKRLRHFQPRAVAAECTVSERIR